MQALIRKRKSGGKQQRDSEIEQEEERDFEEIDYGVWIQNSVSFIMLGFLLYSEIIVTPYSKGLGLVIIGVGVVIHVWTTVSYAYSIAQWEGGIVFRNPLTLFGILLFLIVVYIFVLLETIYHI